jgi:tetratricopeptide (TPR) repeat protein
LGEARKRLLKGNYAEAQQLYERLLKEPKRAVAAAVGLNKALQSQGEYDAALKVLDEALRERPKDADLNANRAELLFARGRWDDADKAVAVALAAAKEHFLAHWVAAQLSRDRGDLKKAEAEFRWFVRTYSDRSNQDKDVTDPDELLLVGLAGCEHARWHHLSDQFQFILSEVYGEAAKKDKLFWPAEYQAGRLYMEKHSQARAFRALNKALAINPSAAEVHAVKGYMALQKFEIDEARRLAERALGINPRLPEALRLEADVHLQGGDLAKALKTLEKARAINPRDEATLARLAACHFVTNKHNEFQAVVKEVESFNAKPGAFYTDLAERLDERKRFSDAERYYKKALALRPNLVEPLQGLGMLYLRMGREDEARDVLDRAFKADDFNVRVLNALRVLDHLEKYQTLKTEHFVFRFDPKNDQILANFMAKYLEEIYADLVKKFSFRPRDPILVELFNKHEMFSGRITSLPDLHTIGACTGRIFAMVSTRDQSKIITKPFNWVRVLRHEMVHIFNLEQTNFQVPHWLTEGLAVSNEGFPMPGRWNQILKQRVPANQLMNLDNVQLGFIRPRVEDEWQLAYCQSFLYVEFLRTKYGADKIGPLLNAYRDGLDTAAAIRKVCGVEQAEFEKGYKRYLDDLVKSMAAGKAPAKMLSFRELQQAHERQPQNNDTAAQLAEMYYVRGDKKQARKLADAVLGRKADHVLGRYVKARLLADSGDDEKALALLVAAAKDDPTETKVLKVLGDALFEANKFAEAAKTYEQARKAEPYEERWLTLLARVYSQGGETDKLIDVLKKLAPANADDLGVRQRLAQLLLKKGNNAEAEVYARQGLEIDVNDRDSQRSLEAALKAQNKEKELRDLRQLLEGK